MFKTLLSLLVSFLLTAFLYSQNQYTQQFIEENGDGKTIISSYDELQVALGWTSITASPEPFGRSIGGVIGNYLYVFGGQANSSFAAAYNLTSNTWSASTPSSVAAYNAGFVVANGELYKISGTGAVTIMEKFTPKGTGTGTWTALTAGPTDVMNSQNAAAWDGGDYIYVHSSNYSTTAPASFLSRYSISGNSWSALTPTSIIKRYPGLVYHNGFLYLIGGLVLSGDDGTICLKYEIATNTWSPIASLPEVANFSKWTTTVVGDKIALVGSGGGYSTYPANPKVFYYDVATNVWAYDGDTPITRGLALAFYLLSESKIFFGGGNEGNVSTNYQATCWTGDGGFIPVELTSFTAKVSNGNVILNWTTATEVNNQGFEVERKIANDQYLNIGEVQGNGTTTERKEYSFTDANAQIGSYTYRLKQVDFNGTFEYSNEIFVNVTAPLQFALEQNYPNPFNPSTTINFSIAEPSFVKLAVYNLLGEELKVLKNENMSAGTFNVSFDPSSLPSGMYLYKIETAQYTSVRKMMLMK